MSSEVLDFGNIPTALVDSLVRVDKMHGITYFVFAETTPITHGEGGRQRSVAARIAIPDTLVVAITLAMVNGIDSKTNDEVRAHLN